MAQTIVEQLKRMLLADAAFGELLESVQELRTQDAAPLVNGVSGSFLPLLISLLAEKTGRMHVLIARDRTAAEQYRDDVSVILGSGAVAFFSGREGHAQGETGKDVSDIQTLRTLQSAPPSVLVTHPQALLMPLPSPVAVARQSFTLEAGMSAGHAATVKRLTELDFVQKDFVETYGDFAVRGGILDIFPFVGDNPVRAEFVGDTVESLREFDPLSQRSIKELSIAVIVPDVIGHVGGDAAPHSSTILDYASADPVLVLDEPDVIASVLRESAADNPDVPLLLNAIEEPGLFARLQISASGRGLDFGTHQQPSFNASIATLHRDLAQLQARGYSIIITSDSPSEMARLKDLLGSIGTDEETGETRDDLSMEHIEFALDALHEGFVFPAASLALYTEHQIFNRLKRRGRKRIPKFKGFTERELRRLTKGDFVVHEDFGIGRFNGLKTIRVRGAEQEVVSVLYEEKDTLYVNLNYIGKLQKYSSKEGHVPRLTRLGSQEWEKLKSRVKKRVKDIARDLIQLYAKRKHLTGFAFSKDTPWQKELEASFMYEDTFDQAKATLEVKEDMEAPHPMDRLVCGDVGFGKTEVAVRAAFKAVLDGRQVAVLVPTTILAQQHFNTFLDRTGRYGVRVEVLSRFKQKKEQAAILEKLKTGGVDIIIGTHRLLSKDVSFKNLGLLVIDEEHRFGVAAKEKLRHLRADVDTLSMTATPIPRTLHFSLMGARDLSIIATPPRNRLPVTTEMAQWGEALIADAITREMHRGGQVYFVHDRVQDIQVIAARIKEIVPAARIRTAHGQMQGHELEEVMMGFLERQFDVLVATKIIESGLDIPNVNTIVINRADRFGMAELYQLRGRVGRSNVQAYAYLLTPPVSSLPRPTLQRLQAVEEFTELGSGFNLSMRDLEIRGAGNLLGSEQSGFIESMGFETYTRILEEAVRELKDEEFRDLFKDQERPAPAGRETLVEVDFDAMIPAEYVGNDTERLAIYRRLYALTSELQLQEVADELKDRFGLFPPAVENLFAAVRIRLVAARIGFTRVNLSSEAMEADFPPEEDTQFYEGEDFQHLMTVISKMKNKGVALKQSGKTLRLAARLKKHPPEAAPHVQALSLLTALLPPTPADTSA